MKEVQTHPLNFVKGRGVGSNVPSRFNSWTRTKEDVEALEDEADGDEPKVRTEVTLRQAKSIISRNSSPDLGFDQSINPYQGCEHGCVYCFARPTHAYLGLSPGLDFETKIFAKSNAAELLRKEFASKKYQPGLIALGAATDPYQPIDRKLGITRQVLEVLAECNAPVAVTTKSALVVRDIDLLAPMAAKGLVRVHMSIATLDNELGRKMDPRANAPAKRLEAIRELSRAGIPVSVYSSPMIPAINDMEMESILEAAAAAGATQASMVILRLPLEVRDLFVEWLQEHFPQRAKHVMSLVSQLRDGKDYDSSFGTRMTGTGVLAGLLRQRFELARKSLGLAHWRLTTQGDTSQFRPPREPGGQADLF
ncbi:PA0069 family radical SAM protein [Caenimonas soli]|uniref:PA0069 family radical SAM protein n=1 Tax=Caenimonas soli TaxID=2735555 RepID=UPI0015545652|nr:PA0069 family radical SAM protein [Caenimonas soli]NPC58461.1 PA0069 family radical SAM protein [Caenimonas soli]